MRLDLFLKLKYHSNTKNYMLVLHIQCMIYFFGVNSFSKLWIPFVNDLLDGDLVKIPSIPYSHLFF